MMHSGAAMSMLKLRGGQLSFLIQSLNTFITKQKSEKRKQKRVEKERKKIQNEKNEPGQKTTCKLQQILQ